MTAELVPQDTSRRTTSSRTMELQSLRENVERFRLLVENSNDLVVEVTLDGQILYLSPNLKAVLGHEPEDLLHTSVFDHVHPDDLPHVQEQFALPEGRATCRYRHQDGSWRWLETTGRDFFLPGGEKRGVLIARDITDRKNAEEALRQSEERTRAILENALDAVVTMSPEGLITSWNTQAETIFGWKRDEVLGRSMSEVLLPERFHQAHEEELRRLLGVGQSLAMSRRLEMTALHRDGREIPIELAITPLNTTQGVSFSGFIRDLTEQKDAQRAKAALEAQLRQAQKLDALAQLLAGGIAHDFNNILSIIMAYGELAGLDADNPEALRKHLGEVRKASERAKDLVRQILTFSRRQKQERRPARLQLIIQEALKLLRSTLPTTIEIDSQIDFAAPVVLADPTQIHQVMMNLCTNAAHALRERPGRLSVSLNVCEVDEALARALDGLRMGTYLQLTVSDTGHGMDAETLKHIYEPFFTTKARGEGTGLGLPVVHGIVKEHEGAIAVQSSPGVGTTFDLYFPVRPTMPVESSEIPAALPRGNAEQILFVDDEPAICESAKIMLERLGYCVTTHTNPAEALFQFRQDPDRFALVITDLTMPGVTGHDLARQVFLLRPQTPVLLATGSIGLGTPEKVRECGVRDLITKPITPMVLATTIHRVLNNLPKDNQSNDCND